MIRSLIFHLHRKFDSRHDLILIFVIHDCAAHKYFSLFSKQHNLSHVTIVLVPIIQVKCSLTFEIGRLLRNFKCSFDGRHVDNYLLYEEKTILISVMNFLNPILRIYLCLNIDIRKTLFSQFVHDLALNHDFYLWLERVKLG